MPTKSQPKLITQPEDWWAAFERAADADGLTLAAWVGECCVARLPKSEARKLTKRRRVGAPKLAKKTTGK